MATISDFLSMTLERDASDLHYMAGDPPRIRQYGELMPLSDNRLDAEKVRQSIEAIITPKARIELEEKDGADFAYELEGKGKAHPFSNVTPLETQWSHQLFTAALSSHKTGNRVAL